MPSSYSQDWKFFIFRAMDDTKRTNNRIDALDQIIKEKLDDIHQSINQKLDARSQSTNQKVDALNRKMEEKIMNQGNLASRELVNQLTSQLQAAIVQLREDADNGQKQIKSLLDTVEQLKAAFQEGRHASMEQGLEFDHLKAAVEIDHATLFDLAGEIEQVKMGGTSELSRVNNEIAMKAGKREVERQLRALRAGGTEPNAMKQPRQEKSSPSTPITSIRPAQQLLEELLKEPVVRRRRMPLKRKAEYDFKTTDGRSGRQFLEY